MPCSCTVTTGGARLELVVDTHISPHVHAAQLNNSSLPYGTLLPTFCVSAWRFILAANYLLLVCSGMLAGQGTRRESAIFVSVILVWSVFFSPL